MLLEKLRKEAEFTPDKEFQDREALSEEDIRLLCSQFDIQSHGRYHFSATTLSDSELRRELADSRERTEMLSEAPCEHFSFPYGDHSAREINVAKSVGYKSLRTTKPGWIGQSTDVCRIPITADVGGDASICDLQLHLTGIPRFLKRTVDALVTKHLYAMRQRILMSNPFF